MSWIRACTTADVDEDTPYKVETVPPIAVFCHDGEYSALDDTCSHGQSSLCDGYIEDGAVECALHMARFDLKTGAALCLPATRGVQSYPVRVEGDEIHIDVPAQMLEGALID